mgnify:CR=1 FL=1|jgi:cation transport ATPase
MNHQPFENWILDEYDLTPDDRRKLSEHLEVCPKCMKLEKGWRSARHEVKSMPAINAPADFGKRWQMTLAEKRQKQAQQQTKILLICLISSALAIIITLGVFLLPHTSWITVAVSIVTSLVQFFSTISQLWILMTSIVKSAPTSFLVSLGLLLSFTISLITVFWGISFYRITTKGPILSHEK